MCRRLGVPLAGYRAARDDASVPICAYTNQLAALAAVDSQMQALFASPFDNQ
jgi:hypothetical protein